MYVEAIINGKSLQAMLDTEANTVYMPKELADEISLSCTKERGSIKGVNTRVSRSMVLLVEPKSKSASGKVR